MRSCKIINGNIFRPDNEFHKGDLSITDGLIVEDNTPDEIIDAENLYVIPSLSDIHFHGCKGYDFCDATQEAFRAIKAYESSVGVRTLCPATMTLPEERLLVIMSEAKNFGEFAGIYLEGPFISRQKIGAQNPEYVHDPDIEMFKKLQDKSGGLIKIAAIAPELEGSFEFIESAKNLTKLSLAHTACNYETASKAFAAGLSQVTHLFNAMSPINHREPGPIIAALENKSINVELICDGFHVHPSVVRETIKSFGSDRVIFVSDSTEATGLQDGRYSLGGIDIIKNGSKATLLDGVTLAGSATNLFDCMKFSVLKMGVRLETAVKCSSINPAKILGLDKSIRPGNKADVILLDKRINLLHEADPYCSES